LATTANDELQWFFYLIIDRELVPEEPCRALLRDLGPEASLVAATQAIFDEGLCGDFGALQQAVGLARINARRGSPPRTIRPAPPKLVEPEPEDKLELPDLAGIETLSTADTGAIMRGILGLVRQHGASDLHISAGSPIFWRRYGRLEMCPPETALTHDAASHLCLSLLDEETLAAFEDRGDVEVALELEGGCRYRANVSYSRSGVTGTYHIVPDEVRSLEELGFANHADIARLMENDNGLFLVTGPAGSGKTSTLAALVDVINRKRYCHVITIEDPIEIIYPIGTCFITQRQVGLHTHGYASALKAALREDPDVIVIGEMHDLETMEIAITASETGHLVLATLHTRDAASTLSRLLGVFPPNQQSQIRAMVSESLRGIICQQLLPSTDHRQVLASELLVNTAAVGNLVREGKAHLLEGVMQTGISAGMQSMDRCLLQLFAQGSIDEQATRLRLHSRDSLARLEKLKEQRSAAPPPPPPAPPPSTPPPPANEGGASRRYL
jgi:twitching motility protein PilT